MNTTNHSFSSVKRISVAAVMLLFGVLTVLSCKREPVEPVSYSKRQPIPIGPYTITVTHVEGGDFSALSGLGIGQGIKGIAVYMTVRSEKSMEEDELESFRSGRKTFRIRDQNDKTYSSNLVMFADAFRMMKSTEQIRDFKDFSKMSRDSQRLRYGLSQGEIDIVVIFGVPFSSRGYTLFIENKRPRSGQPRIAAVSLGR